MRDRLQARDYRFIAICLALLAATTWFSVRNFYRAFPEASIDFRVNRGQAESLALQFLAQHLQLEPTLLRYRQLRLSGPEPRRSRAEGSRVFGIEVSAPQLVMQRSDLRMKLIDLRRQRLQRVLFLERQLPLGRWRR